MKSSPLRGTSSAGSSAPRPRSPGPPGWQANARSREVYDDAGLLYGSDSRGTEPYFPLLEGRTFRTLEIPTTLPTFDELIGRPEFPEDRIVPHLISLLRPDVLNVFTLHAELEGMSKRALFGQLLAAARRSGVEVTSLGEEARDLLAARDKVPVRAMVQGAVDGRSGSLAIQSPGA